MTRVARRSSLAGKRRTAPPVISLLGGNENGSTAHTGVAAVGRIETWPQTITTTGTIKELKFKLRSAVAGVTAVWLGVIADDGTGSPVHTTVLVQGSTTTGVKEAGIVTVKGLSLAVKAGDKVHFAAMALGGELTYYGEAATGFSTHESNETHTTLEGTTTWDFFNGTEIGPVYFAALGEVTGETIPGAPVLSVNGTDHQTVEWHSVGADNTGYDVAISLEPSTVTTRTTAYTKRAKTADPQKFKPEPNVAYGEATKVTPGPGQTVYVGVRVDPTGAWATEVAVTMPGEEGGGGGGGTGFLKGVEMQGWAKSDETGDAKEAKLTGTRLNKPGRTEYLEWTAIGVEPIFLYAYGVSGQTSSGIKSLNRAEWVASAMAKIKETKPKYFEALNEPSGSWFWGSAAGNLEEAKAYLELLKLLKQEIVAKLPESERPLVLASLDGGHAGEHSWVERLKEADANYRNYFDIGTCHPYGGTGERAKASLGHRDNVEAIHSFMGGTKDMMITEVGFPTIHSTSDSLQYSEAEAAASFASFLAWAKGLPWMRGVIIYGYRDGSGEPAGYGQWKLDDSPKLAVPKIAAA